MKDHPRHICFTIKLIFPERFRQWNLTSHSSGDCKIIQFWSGTIQCITQHVHLIGHLNTSFGVPSLQESSAYSSLTPSMSLLKGTLSTREAIFLRSNFLKKSSFLLSKHLITFHASQSTYRIDDNVNVSFHSTVCLP